MWWLQVSRINTLKGLMSIHHHSLSQQLDFLPKIGLTQKVCESLEGIINHVLILFSWWQKQSCSEFLDLLCQAVCAVASMG